MIYTRINKKNKIVIIYVLITIMLFCFSCITWPYYKVMPYLPAVNGHVTDYEDNTKIENVTVHWKNEKNDLPYITSTNSDGYFEFKVIDKYITWKIVMMDPGWGGTLVFEKDGYMKTEYSVGGLYNPSHVFEIEVKLEKVKH